MSFLPLWNGCWKRRDGFLKMLWEQVVQAEPQTLSDAGDDFGDAGALRPAGMHPGDFSRRAAEFAFFRCHGAVFDRLGDPSCGGVHSRVRGGGGELFPVYGGICTGFCVGGYCLRMPGFRLCVLSFSLFLGAGGLNAGGKLPGTVGWGISGR